jgi:hypothetical protein
VCAGRAGAAVRLDRPVQVTLVDATTQVVTVCKTG